MANISLKEIFTGIKEDYENEYAHSEYNTVGGYRYTHRTPLVGHHRSDPNFSTAIWKLYMPNILGFFLGLALCAMFGGEGAAFIVMAALGSVLVGMVDNMIMRKMDVVPALIRNIVMMGIMALVCGFFMVLYAIDSK